MRYKEKLLGDFNDYIVPRILNAWALGLHLCEGLFIVIAEKFWAEGKINVGATFYFTLPKPSLNEQFERD